MDLVCSVELAAYCQIAPAAPERSPVLLAKTAALPEAATPVQSLSPDEIAKITQQLEQANIGAAPQGGGQLSVEEDNDDADHDKFGGYREASYSDGDSDNNKDFTACSGDDCGWCGHCDY
jgi:hypothetical protein